MWLVGEHFVFNFDFGKPTSQTRMQLGEWVGGGGGMDGLNTTSVNHIQRTLFWFIWICDMNKMNKINPIGMAGMTFRQDVEMKEVRSY